MQVPKIPFWMIACLFLIPAVVRAASPADLIEKGNRAYSAGRYDEALKDYDAAGVDAVKSPQIDFNRGAAYFKKGDLAKAKAAWENAALNSRNIFLEAKALYNLGNCEFFEAKRQTDSDPQKALDACARSITYFQEALDLLRKPETESGTSLNSLKKDASENIEIVRLVMKSILDELKKQQEQAEKQQQASENLKNLIDRQKALANHNRQLADEKQAQGETPSLKDKALKLAEDQEQLRRETKAAADQLQGSSSRKPDPSQKAREHLNQAQTRQRSAVEKISAEDLSKAQKDQENAIKEMENALNALEKSQKETGPGKQEQPGETQTAGKKAPTEPNQDSAQKHQEMDMAAGQENAETILNEEKENKKNRRPVASGGYREVDKDW